MLINIRTRLRNITGRAGNPERPVRLPYVSRFGRTLNRPGDSVLLHYHLESRIDNPKLMNALRYAVQNRDIEIVHEVKVGETWLSLEDLVSAEPRRPETPDEIQASVQTTNRIAELLKTIETRDQDLRGARKKISELEAELEAARALEGSVVEDPDSYYNDIIGNP